MVIENDQQNNESERVQFHCRIGNIFADRLDKHILSLERMNRKRVTRHLWIEEAIQKKLDREVNLHPADIPKEARISLRLVKSLSDEINDKVSLMKRFRTTYSKNKWVIEAIEEKLEEEHQQVAQWRNSHWDSTSTG